MSYYIEIYRNLINKKNELITLQVPLPSLELVHMVPFVIKEAP